MAIDLQEIHEQALRDFKKVQSKEQFEREQCLEDRRFCDVAGAQWEGPLEEQFESRPKYEINRVKMAVKELEGDYRNNRISVNFEPDDEDSDSASNTCDSVFRKDEKDSHAKEAYDNAFSEGIKGGIGAWLLDHDYEDEYDDENDYQRIGMYPIYDADSCVYFDENAKRADKADAKYAYRLYSLSHEAFEEEWDRDVATIPKAVSRGEFDWKTGSLVYIADYYKIEEVRETIIIFKNDAGEEKKMPVKEYNENQEDIDLEHEITGFVEEKRRKIKKRKVHKYIISGSEVLEDCGYIAGKYIPIIPFYADRCFVDNTERMMGVVRLVKDAQRLKNMQISNVANLSAKTGYEKPILLPEQVKGLEMYWQTDNVKDWAYLPIKAIKGADGEKIPQGPVDYLRPPSVPPTWTDLNMQTNQDIVDLLGVSKSDQEVTSNIASGTVRQLHKRSDRKNLLFMDNFARAMEWCGVVWLSMASEIYVEENRKIKGLKKEGRGSYPIEIMKPMTDEKGNEYHENDFAKMKMSVSVDVGPMSETERDSIVEQMIDMMQYIQNPQDQEIMSAIAMRNLNGEGMGDSREFYRKKLVQLGVEEPTEEDIAEMEAQQAQAAQQAQQPDPQEEYLQSEAQLNQIKAMKEMAEIEETNADTAKKQAETVETYAGIEREDFKAASEIINNGIRPAVPMGEFQ